MRPWDVVHEDARLLAARKPAGMVVIPGRGEVGEPLLREAERRCGARLYVVHRLDREASGLVLFAKDAATHRELCLRFERRQVRKRYLAAVQGPLREDGRVDLPLRSFGSGRVAPDPAGKPCSTVYRVREALRGSTLLELEPLTGRRHQLRAHLYAVGHPILGDSRYGKDRPVGGAPRLMLHALELELDLGGALRLVAEPPEDFLEVVGRLRAR